MFAIKQPSTIIFGKYSARDYDMPKDSLVITSKGTRARGWLDYTHLNSAVVFDEVEPNPSIESVQKIINEFSSTDFSHVIGLGGGSSLDVAKYVAFKLKKRKIMIPTTFGSGSEVTRISVLKVNGKKQSFHDDGIFADVAIVDSFFIYGSDENVIKNSVIDACAQCTEGFDSKLGNEYTKFLCKKAFDLLEDGILHDNKENIVLGSLFAGLGFGNCSTTLGHALSYVYSNEGYLHGHALAFTTTVAHQYNQSVFYDRFLKIVKKLNFSKINLKQNLDDAASLVMTDRKHLDNNPTNIAKADIVLLLKKVNSLTI
jgi:succinate semialdehyde reductase